MKDITIKLHIAVMRYVHDRVENTTKSREDGFTTAELLGNAALAMVALVGIWQFFQKGLFDNVSSYVTANFFH